MQFLNLDELAGTARVLTIGDTKYPVVEMSVENFIETSKETEDLKARGNVTAGEDMVATIKMVIRFIPTLEDAVIRKLSMKQLGTLLRFVRGELDDEAKTAQAPEGKKVGKSKVVSNQ